MNRVSVLLVSALVPLLSIAQIGILPYDSLIGLHTDHTITIEGWADYNSSSVYNELPWNIYRGGYIDHELRERSRAVLNDRNSVGYDVGIRLHWIGRDSLFGWANSRPIVSIGYRNTMGATFSRDVFGIAFFGNAQYEDQTAYLSPSAHRQMSWQSVGFGIQRDRSFIRLDLLRGRSLNASELRTAEVYTAPFGQEFQVVMDAEYWRSDTAGGDQEHTNGIGAAISGRWHMPITIAGKNSSIAVSVDDLGVMQWNVNAVRIERDTSFVFDGLEVENIFDLDDVLIGEEQLIDTFGLNYMRESFATLTPFRVAASLEFPINDQWQSRLTVDHRHLPGYIPQAVLSASRRFSDRALIGISAAYGGFGVLRFGLAARIRFGEFALLELGSMHVPGFFLGNTRGAGAHVSLSIGL